MSASKELFPFRIVGQAFASVWSERAEFVKMAALPVIALSILSAVLWIVYPPEPVAVDSGPLSQEELSAVLFSEAFSRGRILELIADAVLYVMFAVAWHRFFLIEDEETTVARALSWDANKTYFLVALISVGLIAMAASIPAGVAIQLLFGLAAPGTASAGIMFGTLMAIMFYVLGRLSPIFPSTALGLRIGLRGAWRLTAGSGWRMAMILMFPYIPTFVALFIVGSVLNSLLTAIGLGDAATGKLIMSLGTQTIAYFGLAVGVTALSIAYRDLIANPPATYSSRAD